MIEADIRIHDMLFNPPAGDLIKFARDESGLSNAQIAEAVGVNPNVIAMWANGAKIPTNRIPALAKALDIDLTQLFVSTCLQFDRELLETFEEVFGYMLTPAERSQLAQAQLITVGI